MKRFTIYIIGALLVCWCTSVAFARIGENEEQIEARYGKSVVADPKGPHGPQIALFKINGMEIGVTFRDGKSVMEIYSNQDLSRISANEIRLLLDANAAAGTWEKSNSGLPMWKLNPEGCVATLSMDGRKFAVFGKGYVDISNVEREKAEKEKLKGF